MRSSDGRCGGDAEVEFLGLLIPTSVNFRLQVSPTVVEQVDALLASLSVFHKEEYFDLNECHFQEKLAIKHQIEL